ncbi:uncharacterized protein LOC126908830 [Daktulosphaira vitifoliae]|uniref:uncharacterized protein LOC126908830 n=1 Tax=Daktulosphaira vitifoliae TaxID=58002 RepID=UPI0021A991B2|nr:uncharacterized protein LOC126908830 [Daktulosphaira vitifoliae]
MHQPIAVLLFATVFAIPAKTAFIRTSGIELPTYTDPCKRNDKDFSGCLKKTLQYLIPKFSKEGIPQLNITTLDPYHLDEYLMHFDSAQIDGKCLFKNVNDYGLSTIRIVDVRFVTFIKYIHIYNINKLLHFIIPLGKHCVNDKSKL